MNDKHVGWASKVYPIYRTTTHSTSLQRTPRPPLLFCLLSVMNMFLEFPDFFVFTECGFRLRFLCRYTSSPKHETWTHYVVKTEVLFWLHCLFLTSARLHFLLCQAHPQLLKWGFFTLGFLFLSFSLLFLIESIFLTFHLLETDFSVFWSTPNPHLQ